MHPPSGMPNALQPGMATSMPPSAGWTPNPLPTRAPAQPSAIASTATERLPRPPRPRGAGMAALAVVLVVGGAATAGLLALRIDDRVDMLVASHDIAPGQQITTADLAVAPVASEGLDLVPASRRGEVLGQFAAVPIPAGRLFDAKMVSPTGLLRKGKVAVGVVVKAGQAPASGLESGDQVTVVRTADTGGTTLTDAVVSSVHVAESGGFGGGGGGGDTTVTLIVDAARGPDVAAVSASGHMALLLTTRGGAVDQG